MIQCRTDRQLRPSLRSNLKEASIAATAARESASESGASVESVATAAAQATGRRGDGEPPGPREKLRLWGDFCWGSGRVPAGNVGGDVGVRKKDRGGVLVRHFEGIIGSTKSIERFDVKDLWRLSVLGT